MDAGGRLVEIDGGSDKREAGLENIDGEIGAGDGARRIQVNSNQIDAQINQSGLYYLILSCRPNLLLLFSTQALVNRFSKPLLSSLSLNIKAINPHPIHTRDLPYSHTHP